MTLSLFIGHSVWHSSWWAVWRERNIHGFQWWRWAFRKQALFTPCVKMCSFQMCLLWSIFVKTSHLLCNILHLDSFTGVPSAYECYWMIESMCICAHFVYSLSQFQWTVALCWCLRLWIFQMTAPRPRTPASWKWVSVCGHDHGGTAREGRGESTPASVPHSILREWWPLLLAGIVSEARDRTPAPPPAHTTPQPTGGKELNH